MWTKDDYQEHMLSYLGGVQTVVETLESPIGRGGLVELYENLDTSLERLWRLIRASDTDWERFRFPLEASFDDLLRAFYRVVLYSGEPAFAEVRRGQRKYMFKEWAETLLTKG